MESEIIVEGFRRSMKMHGLVYKQILGDGDSSVYRKVLESCPYGPTVFIEKIECKNHVLRNYGSKLRDICTNRKVKKMGKRQIIEVFFYIFN